MKTEFRKFLTFLKKIFDNLKNINSVSSLLRVHVLSEFVLKFWSSISIESESEKICGEN